MEHPDFDTLVQYAGGLLPEAARAEFEAHLAQPCAACTRKLAELRAVLATAAADRTVPPPAAVLQQAVAAFDRRPAPQPLLRVLATLAFDSRSQLSLAAVRGTSAKRQMLFTTQQVDIDLQISPEKGEHRLVGQILGAEAESAGETAAAFVSLNDPSGEALQGTETDAHGQFSFPQVPVGVYDLVFDLAGQEIAITRLEIRDDQG
jgi:anti-sigma factor RsiW